MDIKSQIKAIQAKFIQVLSGQPVEESRKPEGKFERDDQPLGILQSPVTRSFYCLCEELGEILEIAGKELEVKSKDVSPEGLDAKLDIERQLAIGAKLARSMSAMFWIGVMEEFPLTANEENNAGIRADWQVTIELDICDCPRCVIKRAIETITRGEGTMKDLVDMLKREMDGPQGDEYKAIFPPSIVELLSVVGEAISLEELLARVRG